MRIKVISGPWPERIGATGIIVTPGRTCPVSEYPRVDGDDVVVRLDDDPLEAPDSEHWTCVIARANVEAV